MIYIDYMINIEPQGNIESVRSTLNIILAAAESRKLKEKELARLAGVRPETLSRLKSRGTADFALIDRLARAVGLKLAVVPDDDQLARIQQGRFFS
jgi:transcriptional regulator with XRE-family HTH domain